MIQRNRNLTETEKCLEYSRNIKIKKPFILSIVISLLVLTYGVIMRTM